MTGWAGQAGHRAGHGAGYSQRGDRDARTAGGENQSSCILRMVPPSACCHSLSRWRRKDSAPLPAMHVDKGLVTWIWSPFSPPPLTQACPQILATSDALMRDSDLWTLEWRLVVLLSQDPAAATVLPTPSLSKLGMGAPKGSSLWPWLSYDNDPGRCHGATAGAREPN